MDFVPVDELHSPAKVSPPSSFQPTGYWTSSDFFSLKGNDATGISWSIFGVRHKKGLFFLNIWKQKSVRRVQMCTPLSTFISVPCIAKSKLHTQSVYEEVCIALFILYFYVPVNPKID